MASPQLTEVTLVGAFQPVELAGAAQDELAVDVEEGEGELHVELFRCRSKGSGAEHAHR